MESARAAISLGCRQLQGALGGLYRVARSAGLGIGGGQSSANHRTALWVRDSARSANSTALRAIADEGIRPGRQNPGNVVQGLSILGIDSHSLLVLN